MSGSVKYVVGAPPGPKSRGGLVTVLGGAAGPAVGAWALARPGATAAAPATAPMALMSVRREIRLRSSRSNASCVMRPSLGANVRDALALALLDRCALH